MLGSTERWVPGEVIERDHGQNKNAGEGRDGNAFEALRKIRWLLEDVSWLDPEQIRYPKRHARLEKALAEFYTYIENTCPFIPNYGESYRYGEPISTAFTESAVNEIISRRMVKKQQMRWTQIGAHSRLQVRTQTLNDDLRSKFSQWYPGIAQVGPLVEGQMSAQLSC